MKDEVYEFLMRPRRTKLAIRAKQLQIDDLHLMMLPGAIRYDKDIVQSSPEDPMLKFAERLDTLEREIKALKLQYVKEQQQIAGAIEELEDFREGLILMGRYVKGYSYEEIAAELALSQDRIYQLHRSACEKMIEIIQNYSELQ